jgi:hypothetical protein
MNLLIKGVMNCFDNEKASVLSETIESQKLHKPVERSPTCHEIMAGVPEWWSVSETNSSLRYISTTGKRFDSVNAVTHWRKYGPFEDPDWSIPSF